MAKAASLADLQALHALLTRSFTERLEADIKDNIPTDAATLGALAKFLKDNSVTADPANKDDLLELRDKLSEAARLREQRRGAVLALAKTDAEAA